MPLRSLALAALLTLACGTTDPPSPAAEPAPPEPAVAPTETAPESQPPRVLATSTLPWVWYHAHPTELADTLSQIGVSPIAYDHRIGDRRRYAARRVREGTMLISERLPEPGTEGEPVLAWHTDVTAMKAVGLPVVQALPGEPTQIALALRIPGGYERSVVTSAGDRRSSFLVLDPPGFDSPEAAIQLGGTSEHPLVYVRGTGRAYLDELDPATGRPVARARFEREVLHDEFPWPPEGPRGRRLGHRWPAEGGGHYRAQRRGDAIELHATASSGEDRWRTVLDPKGAVWSDSAVLLEHAHGVVVVVYNGIAAGSTAYVVDRESGSLRFSGAPGSLGSIGHSKYLNELALSVDDGRVLVHGHEAGGDYLGVLDVEAGRLLGHEVWRH